MVSGFLAQLSLADLMMTMLLEEARCCLLVGVACCHCLLTAPVLTVHWLGSRFVHSSISAGSTEPVSASAPLSS